MRLFEGTPFDRPPKCDVCGELEADCNCQPEPFRIPPEKQTARIAVEKRKRGKVVTVIRGLPEVGNDLPVLLTQLKSTCGAGGALVAMVWSIEHYLGLIFTIRSFMIVVTAGLGNLAGVVVAGTGLGALENMAGFILGTEFQIAFVFGLLIVILVGRSTMLGRKRLYLK